VTRPVLPPVLRPFALAALLALLQTPGTAGARGAAELIAEGNAALKAGLVPEAISRYEAARDRPGGTGVALFNMGVALVRQENYPAALTAFQSIDERDATLAPLVHYNQGNVLARLGQSLASQDPAASLELYRRSLGAYQRALALQPRLLEAAYNLEVVRMWIAELRKQGGQGQGSESTQAGPPQGDRDGRQGSSPPGSSPQESPGGETAPDQAPGGGPGQATPEPGTAGPQDNPWGSRDETARSILEEERKRREEEANWTGGENSDGRPNW
jgi:tetratricopeptide (TPR) repeat protein